MEPDIRKRSLVGPVILIALGVLVLVSNLGLLPWGVWGTIWRLWPIALVAWGLDLLIGRRYEWGSWAVLGIVGLLLVVALTVQQTQPTPSWWRWGWGWGPRAGQLLDSQEVNQGIDGATSARINLEPGLGQLELTSHTTAGSLIQGTVQPYPGEEIERVVDKKGDQIIYELNSWGPTFSMGPGNPSPRWQLSLTQEIPIDLNVDSGVGETFLDLRHLTLSHLDIDSGIGVIDIVLPEKGNFKANIDAGVGEVNVRVPKGLAAQIRVNKGLGDISVKGNYNADGSGYISPNFDQATDRVELSVNGGVGSITIREID